MLQFTNGFTCAVNQEKGEVMITFLQQSPQIGDDGKMTSVKTEEIVSLVMGRVVTKNLLDSLTEILETNDAV